MMYWCIHQYEDHSGLQCSQSVIVMIFLSPTLFPNYLLALLFGFDSSLNSVH